MLGFSAAIMSMVSTMFLLPIIPIRLVDFGYSSVSSGYFLLTLTVPYIAGCFCTTLILDKYSKRNIMAYAFLIFAFISTMLGPSEILHYPN